MDKCFIIMPVTTQQDWIPFYGGDKDHFNHVLDHLFIPAVKKAGFEPIPPIAEGSDVIHARIIQQLEKSDMVLCDMSRLNPNVFFELGVRTAVDKPVCLTIDDKTEKPPFDMSVINYHRYDSALAPWHLEGEVAALAEHIGKAVEGSKKQNTMWQRFGLHTHASLSTAKTGMDAQMQQVLLSVDALRAEVRATNRDTPWKVTAAWKPGGVQFAARSRSASGMKQLLEAFTENGIDVESISPVDYGFLVEVARIEGDEERNDRWKRLNKAMTDVMVITDKQVSVKEAGQSSVFMVANARLPVPAVGGNLKVPDQTPGGTVS